MDTKPICQKFKYTFDLEKNGKVFLTVPNFYRIYHGLATLAISYISLSFETTEANLTQTIQYKRELQCKSKFYDYSYSNL